MLSVKQEGIKYHFKSIWYNATWDWTPVSGAIGEYSTHRANEPRVIYFLRKLPYQIKNTNTGELFKIKLNDVWKNGEKKNLSAHFWEQYDGILIHILILYSVYALYKEYFSFFKDFCENIDFVT